MKQISYTLTATLFLLLSTAAFAQTNSRNDKPRNAREIFKKKTQAERLEERKKLIEHKQKEFEQNIKAQKNTSSVNSRRADDPVLKPMKGYFLTPSGADNWGYSYTFTYTRDSAARILTEYQKDTVSDTEIGKTVYIYNPNGRQVSKTTYNHNGTEFVPSQKDSSAFHPDFPDIGIFYASYDYDDGTQTWKISGWAYRTAITVQSGRITSKEEESYNSSSSAWELEYLNEYEYDANGRIVSDISTYYWQGSLDGKEKAVYTFDANGILTGIIVSEWDEIDEEWIENFKIGDLAFNNYQPSLTNEYLVSYTKDLEEDAQLTHYIGYEWDGNEWIEEEKTEASYNANGSETTYYYWDETEEEWIPDYKGITTKSATERVYTSQFFDGATWVNNSRSTTFFSASGEELGNKYEDWDEIVGEWEIWNWNQIFQNFGTNGELLDETYKVWSSSDKKLGNMHKYVYAEWAEFDEDLVSVAKISAQSFCTVYPNPAHDFVTISFDEAISGNKQIRIRDISGRILSESISEESAVTVSVQNYKAGIYILEIASGQNVSVIKLVKE